MKYNTLVKEPLQRIIKMARQMARQLHEGSAVQILSYAMPPHWLLTNPLRATAMPKCSSKQGRVRTRQPSAHDKHLPAQCTTPRPRQHALYEPAAALFALPSQIAPHHALGPTEGGAAPNLGLRSRPPPFQEHPQLIQCWHLGKKEQEVPSLSCHLHLYLQRPALLQQQLLHVPPLACLVAVVFASASASQRPAQQHEGCGSSASTAI